MSDASSSEPGSFAAILPKHAGDPDYPQPWTTSQPREALRNNGEARIVCLSPSVNLTPVGSEMVPVPYMIYDTCDHPENYSQKTFFTSQAVLRFCSTTSHVHGDEAGTGGGVVSGTVGKECEPIDCAPKVRVEGSPVVCHLDKFKMECGNTVGEAQFVRDLSVYPAPANTDPAPGSVRTTTTARSPSSSTTAYLAPGLVETAETAETASLAARIWGTTELAAGGTVVAGGGPEDPVTDVGAIVILLIGGLIATGAVLYERSQTKTQPKPATADAKPQQEKNPEPLPLPLPPPSPGHGARSSSEERKDRCLLLPYRQLQCPGEQRHHVVADRAFRSGSRPDSMNDSTGYLKGMNLGDGLCICLQGNEATPGTQHNAVQYDYDAALDWTAANANGMVPLGLAEDAGARAVANHTDCTYEDLLAQLYVYYTNVKKISPNTYVRQQSDPLTRQDQLPLEQRLDPAAPATGPYLGGPVLPH
jgi:hypothetical protein